MTFDQIHMLIFIDAIINVVFGVLSKFEWHKIKVTCSMRTILFALTLSEHCFQKGYLTLFYSLITTDFNKTY